MLTRTDRRRFAVIAALAMAMLFSPVQAQEGSAPNQPTGLDATATHDSVTLTWDDPQDDSITGYVVLRRVRVNDTGGDFDVLVADTGTAALTYTDDTVAASLTYTYRIKAINEHGVSERSRWSHIDTPEAPVPDQPTGLSAAATHGSVTLTWDDPGDDSITGYVVLRRVRVNDTGGDFDVLVADTGTAALTYTDDTVAASLTYTYRIKAINEHGVSERSRWSHIDTPEAPVPDQPTGLSAAATHDSGTLTWDDPNDDSITGYVILRRIPGVDPEGQFSELVSNTGTDATTYTDDTVSAETRYTYRIKAINEHGVSERSRWSHINVPAAPEAAEGDKQDGEGGGAPGGHGTRANVSEGGTDCPQDTTTTCEVDVGGKATGTIDSDLDADNFKVELEAGTRYQFDLEGAPTGRGTLPDPVLEIRSADDLPLPVPADDDGGVGLNSRVIYTPTSSGIHYLKARKAGTSTGTYTLSVIVLGANGNSEADTDFPNNNTTSGRVDVGASVTGTIGADNDDDWFRVDLEAGKTYQFDLEGADTGRGTQPEPYVALYNPSGTTELGFDSHGGVGRNARLIYTAAATGTHNVLAATGVDEQGTYTLSVRDITPPDDPVDLPDEIALVSNISQSHDGLANVFPPSNLIIGEARVAQRFTTGPSTGRYALQSVVLNLHTSLGTGHVPHVAVHANNSSGNPGTRLAVLDNPDDPIGDDTGSAGNRTFSAPSPLSLDANTSYWVVLTNIATTNSGIDASMTNSNNETTTQGFSIRNTRHVWTGDGPWRQAAGVKLRMEVRGTAVKQGFREGDTDLPTNTNTAGVVEVDGFAARGEIHKPKRETTGYTFDTDWFAVELKAGRTYRIDMKGRILRSPGLDMPGVPVDSELTLSLPQINAIYDEDGDYLFNTFSRDESSAHHLFRVTFHARAGGTYYIAASGESFEAGGYELRVIDITQDTD